MKIIADTHVHVYPEYEPDRVWTAAARALQRHAGNDKTLRMVFLTESRASRYGAMRGSAPSGAWRFSPSNEPEAGRLRHPDEGELWVFTGRQIVTRERIEVLALTLGSEWEDGLPTRETIERILEQQAIPVLSWSPGKWLGERGRCVADMLHRISPEQLFLGDILLRPRGLPTPALFRQAKKAGFRILAGTDPLPPAGEEQQVGRYAVRMDAPFDPQRPVTSIRAAFRDRSVPLECVGRRNGLPEAAMRILRHRFT